MFSGFSPSIKIPVGPCPFHLPGAAGFGNAVFLCDDYLLKQESDKLEPYRGESAVKGDGGEENQGGL